MIIFSVFNNYYLLLSQDLNENQFVSDDCIINKKIIINYIEEKKSVCQGPINRSCNVFRSAQQTTLMTLTGSKVKSVSYSKHLPVVSR